MSEQSQFDYEEVKRLVESTPGCRVWWLDVFRGLRYTPEEVRVFLSAMSGDSKSLLSSNRDADACASVYEYAKERGLDVAGKAYKEPNGDGRMIFSVKQMLTIQQQELLLSEVSGYAKIVFTPQKKSAHFDHSLAKATQLVGTCWLRRFIPKGAMVLEVGASITGLVMSGVDPRCYHAYTPILDARDAGRHSVEGFLKSVMRGRGAGFLPSQVALAKMIVNRPSDIVTYDTIQSDNRPGEVLFSNFSDHDIDLDDAPAIMAKHGARLWIGQIMRMKGAFSGMNSCKVEIPALGARVVYEKEKDEVEFHFRGRAAYSYRHKFSSYVKREERNDFRWHGVYHDYIYTKLPGTTDSVLMYAIMRVRKAGSEFVEQRYVATGLKDKVLVKSMRVDRVLGRWRLVPCQFHMSSLALDKITEFRRSLGVKGNLNSTMHFARSVRVKLFLNGVVVGVEEHVDESIFEALAVYVEVLVSADRKGADFDLVKMLETRSGDEGFLSYISCGVKDLLTDRFGISAVAQSVRCWRHALEKFVAAGLAAHPTSEECHEFARVNGGGLRIAEERPVSSTACVCRELHDVNAILPNRDSYTRSEISDLLKYKEHLLLRMDECKCIDSMEVVAAKAMNHFEASASDSDSSTYVEEEESDLWHDAETGTEASSVSEFSSGVEMSVSVRADTVREYIGVSKFQYDAEISESKRMAKLVFSGGVPSVMTLARCSTAKCKPFLLKVVNQEVVASCGDASTTEVMGLVSFPSYEYVEVKRRSTCGFAAGVADGWHYSSNKLCVMNGAQLATSASDVLTGDYVSSGVERIEFPFVVGPFGAGKTTKIFSKLVAALKTNSSVGYLAFSKASVEQMISMLETSGFSRARSNCFTMDAFLLNRKEQFDVLYIDEAPMAHAGQVMCVVAKSAAKECELYGDFNQIPWCSFTAEFPTPLAGLEAHVKVKERMCVIHRCPYDAIAAWSDSYVDKLVACSCCPHVRANGNSMSLHRIKSVSEVPVDYSVRYLTYTQAEKETLHQVLGFKADVSVLRLQDKGGLATVHEEQGSTRDVVYLVRCNTRYDKNESEFSPSIYNKSPYALVASTRHRLSFRYYTCCEESDAMVKAIERSKDLNRHRQVLEIV